MTSSAPKPADRFKDLPVRKIGMEMKKPPMAQTLDTEDFCRYLFCLWRAS
jgi:hypothetical protein